MSLPRLALFYRQLATMLQAGVPLYQALTTLLAHPQPRRFRACLETLSRAILAGTGLSAAMAGSPRIFTPFQRAVIAAGEKSGTLALAAGRMAEHLEQAHSLELQIKHEMFYPKLVMGIVLLLFWPGVLAGLADRPLLLVVVGLLPLLSFGLLLLLGSLLPRLSGQFSPGIDRLTAKVPVLGKTAQAIAQAYFARCLAFLYHAGIPMPEAVRLACDACGNAVLAERVRPAAARLARGDDIGDALEGSGALDPVVVTMLRTGAATGDLETVLDKAAAYLEETVGLTLHRLKVTVGVAALLNVGFCVGIIAVQGYAGR